MAESGQRLRESAELHELRWVDREGLHAWTRDESQLRMERHARRRTGSGG